VLHRQLGQLPRAQRAAHHRRRALSIGALAESRVSATLTAPLPSRNLMSSGDIDPKYKALIDAFARYDKDGDGFITAGVYRALAASLGQDISEELAQEMVRAMDLDGDGRIDFAEFVSSMS